MKKPAQGNKSVAKRPVQANAQQPAERRRNIPKKPSASVSGMKKGTSKKPLANKTAPVSNKPAAAGNKTASGLKKQPLKRPVESAAAISGGQKKAYSSAVKNRSVKSKKRGSRGGNYILYYLLAGIIAVIVFVVLANTVLFNCGTIEVSGNLRYTSEDITELSGIRLGESLLSIDTEKAEQAIVSSLAYIDAAEVEKSFPTKIKITVKEAEKWFGVQDGAKTYVVSRMGKILEENRAADLPVIIGYETADPMIGRTLASSVEGKTELPGMILNAAETAELEGISSIDISDRFEIKVLVDGRITLELGNSNELESKLQIAKALIEEEISLTEYVTVNITNTEKVYVRDNNIIDNTDPAPVMPPETADGTTETADSDTAEA